MGRRWELSDVEFLALWRDVAGFGLPQPLVALGRHRILGDRLRAERAAREKVHGQWGSDVDEVLASVANPDIRITAQAGVPGVRDKPETLARLHAARKGEWGWVIAELPGETVSHAAGFVVTECAAVGLARAVVAALPRSPIGSERPVPLQTHVGGRREVDHRYWGSEALVSSTGSAWQRAEAFLRAPLTRTGSVTVSQGGSKFGPRGVVRRTLRWMDRTDDGRYAVVSGGDPVAVAVDDARLTAMINAEVAVVVQAIKDERGL